MPHLTTVSLENHHFGQVSLWSNVSTTVNQIGSPIFLFPRILYFFFFPNSMVDYDQNQKIVCFFLNLPFL